MPLLAASMMAALALHVSPGAARADDLRPGAGIYTCVDGQGRRLTSDRPIRECLDREQRELNSDGSLRRTLPPSFTGDERAALEEANRKRQAAEAARSDAARRDRNLAARYKDETAHQKAREVALDPVRRLLRSSQQRLAELDKDRKTLQDEAEFYKGKDMPRALKAQFDANAATVEAQRALVGTHQAELDRLNAFYDEELARLRRLWAGAAPGSLGTTGSAASGSTAH
jgi:hypothetical protein